MRLAVETLTQVAGMRPVGWMTGRPSHTRRLIVEEGGFLYDRDALNDELPIGYRLRAARISSSLIPTRPTTTASTATWPLPRHKTSSPT